MKALVQHKTCQLDFQSAESLLSREEAGRGLVMEQKIQLLSRWSEAEHIVSRLGAVENTKTH